MTNGMVAKNIVNLFKTGMTNIHCLDKLYKLLQKEEFNAEFVKHILYANQDKVNMSNYPFKVADFERVVSSSSNEEEIKQFIVKANLLLNKITFFDLEDIRVDFKETDKYFVNYIDALHMYGILEDNSFISLRVHGADPKLDGLKFSCIELVSESEFKYCRDNIDYGLFTVAGVFGVPTLISLIASYLLHFGSMYYKGTINTEYDSKYIYSLLLNTFNTCEMSKEDFCQTILQAIEKPYGGSSYLEYLKKIMHKLVFKEV